MEDMGMSSKVHRVEVEAVGAVALLEVARAESERDQLEDERAMR